MEFVDLKRQYREYREEIDREIAGVIETAQFIGGPVIKDLEAKLAKHTGVAHAICCASGTDALLLGVIALGIEAGDEILVPDFTFIATAEVVALLGARPVFVDVQPHTFNMAPELIAAKISPKTKGIIPVSLYGQCADMREINDIASAHGLWVMEDGAQSYGALYRGRKSCALSRIATTSFFPAKPLGCYGDGGAMFTDDDALAAKIRMLLNHGQEQRYRHKIVGTNARLDALQAAILRVKLAHFDEELKRRQQVADWYTERLRGIVSTPTVKKGNTSSWAQYTITSERRDRIAEVLKNKGIPTAIHYPLPLHRQEALAPFACSDEELPVSTRASRTVLSLPMHPFLDKTQVDAICAAVMEALA